MNESDKDKSASIIDELLHELSECREDERNSQSQMLQVIAAAGTILGICFGFLSLSSEDSGTVINHFVLALTSCVLSVAFPYITFLGIGNVLRYHHMQNLEDRLTNEIYNNERQEAILHWMSLSSPILTKNITHLKSKYSYAAFSTYVAATVASIFFGLVTIRLVFIQLQQNESPEWMDYLFIGIPIFLILFSLVIFISTTIHANDMYKQARKMAEVKREKRFMNESDDRRTLTGREMMQVFLYFLYPKKKDIQKMLLIPLGAIVGLFYQNRVVSWKLFGETIKNILITILVIDILVYQSRYQWNDIRGVDEDLKAKKRGRLPVNILGIKTAVFLSICLIIVKCTIAVYVSITSGNTWLLFCVLMILIVSIAYELARYKEKNKMIFLLVGVGYFLRFYSGLYTILKQTESIGHSISSIQFLPLYIGYIAFGCYSAILPWTHEAAAEYKKSVQKFTVIVKNNDMHCSEALIPYDIEIISFSKGYLFPLFNRIKGRLYKCSENLHANTSLSLEKPGKFLDPWNIAFFISVLTPWIGICFMNTRLLVKALGIFPVISAYCVGKVSSKTVRILSIVTVIPIICEMLLNVSPLLKIYCAHQLLFLAVYYFLRFKFNPEFDFFKETFKVFVGKRTFERLMAQQSSSKTSDTQSD